MNATIKAINSKFPNALANKNFVSKVSKALTPYGYGQTTLVATSLCCDELCRPLENELGSVYTQTFDMGGLAGFPFGGVTSFGAMAAHIPDGGCCILCYGPHVGVDSEGNVGTVERRGRANGGACCGSAKAAAGFVASHDVDCEYFVSTDEVDAQQTFVNKLLLPHKDRLAAADCVDTELPYALFDAQNDLMQKIVAKGAPNVAGNGTIAMIGGIQLNTPPEMEDYFLPLVTEIHSNEGKKIEDFILE